MKIPTFLLLFTIISYASPNRLCYKDEKCNCYAVSDFEFQCPPDNFEIVVHVSPNKYLKIDCTHLAEYNLNSFPNFDAGQVDFFTMRFCPLPPDNFQATLNHFNITGLKKFYLDECFPKGNVTSELLKGLSDLQTLSMNKISPTFDVDTFEYLPDLVQLFLETNNITELEYMFEHSPKLKVLHLSRNMIRSIPPGVFKNLPELRQLHLWSNALEEITKEAFVGLKNLKSLELSTNNIRRIEAESFAELVNLVNISLRSNKLETISSELFSNNKMLEGVRLGDNPNLVLPDYLFANLPHLNNVNIASSKLKRLPENIFANSSKLVTLILFNNELSDLPQNVFSSLEKLKTLDLSRNKLARLPNDLFSKLKQLEELKLGMNLLHEVSDMLYGLSNLRRLDLSRNRIETIKPYGFKDQTQLTSLDLSYNLYNMTFTVGDYVYPADPFSRCEKLTTINLRHNRIIDIGNLLLTNLNLANVDLSYNDISRIEVSALVNLPSHVVYIDLSNNKITELDFLNIKTITKQEPIRYDALHNNATPNVVNLSNNSFICDCRNFDLVQYLNGNIEPLGIKTLVDLYIGDNKCAQPEEFQHILLTEMPAKKMTCYYNVSECPEECECYLRPYDATYIVDCSGRNLTEYPEVYIRKPRVELNLNNNLLEEGPGEALNYSNVKNLFLANNRIRNLDWVPPEIEVLHLDNNQLSGISEKVLRALNGSRSWTNMTLAGNPWSCGCSALDLQNFLNDNYNKVTRSAVICQEDNTPLIQKKEICKSTVSLVVRILIPILAFLLLTAIAIALYFRFKLEIKVWLYAKNLCLWFVTEEELDVDKVYDIFLSYSHKDEDFVMQNLFPVLENQYKICIHIRDFKAGEFITTQIANSVADSRRTLVVLSDNFLESVWGKLEFRTAHTRAIEEGRARVIVIKYGELNEEKLDEDLKSYLKTNTYVEWGKPWFWNKLKYALPHSPQMKFYHSNQKHANTMLKIDDKFELTAKPELHPESTPPVLLDAGLLKSHPLNFEAVKIPIQTPPAEAPLIDR